MAAFLIKNICKDSATILLENILYILSNVNKCVYGI